MIPNEHRHIALIGMAGVGKSTLVNVLAGVHAGVSPGVRPYTSQFKPYNTNVSGQNFHLWDTAGLEDPEMGADNYLPAVEQASELIRRLEDQGGADLLLHCIRGDQDIETTVRNHRLFYEVLGKSRIPISLVVTHLEKEANLEDWWVRNQDSLRKRGIVVADHACVTTLPGHPKYEESRANIQRLLKGHDGDGKFVMPQERRSTAFLRQFGLRKESKKDDLAKVLMKRCMLGQEIAEGLAEKLKDKGWN